MIFTCNSSVVPFASRAGCIGRGKTQRFERRNNEFRDTNATGLGVGEIMQHPGEGREVLGEFAYASVF